MSEQRDCAGINISGITVQIDRVSSLKVPHEITAVIPRMELRKRLYQNGKLVEESEVILNSITIVHSPIRREHDNANSSSDKMKNQSRWSVWRNAFNNME